MKGIKDIVDLWEKKGEGTMFDNSYEVIDILDYKCIKTTFLVKLACIYHDFAYGIGDMGQWEEIIYLVFPEELLKYTTEQINLWFEHGPVKGEKKKDSGGWFYIYDVKKELKLLKDPEALAKHVEELEEELEKYDIKERELEELNDRLDEISMSKDRHDFMKMLRENGKQMIKM